MKKYIKPIIVSIICVLICITMLGCGVTYHFGNTVNADESFTIDILYAESDMDYGNWIVPTRSYDLIKMFEEQGYEVSIKEEEIEQQAEINEDETLEQEPLKNSYLELKYTVEKIDDLCIKEPLEKKFDVGDFLSGNLQDILEKGIFDCKTTDHSKIYNADFVYDPKFLQPYTDEPTWTRYEDAIRQAQESGNNNQISTLESGKDNSSIIYILKLDKGKMKSENSTEKDENLNAYSWILTNQDTDGISYTFEFPNDVSVNYKEKEIELMTENIEQGTEVHFKVKKLDKLKEIVILDEKNNRIEYKKVEGTEDEYYFIMPTSSVKISIEYKVLNPKTLSGLSIGLNLIIIFAIGELIIINKYNKLIGGSNE